MVSLWFLCFDGWRWYQDAKTGTQQSCPQMSIRMTGRQIVDAGDDHCVDDDDLTEKDDLTARQACSKHGPGALTVCIV